MRVFVAGATGALGRPVVRTLVSRRHEVVGLTRSQGGRRTVEALGARAAMADALDGERLRAAVVAARPDHVVHLLTALPPGGALHPRQLRPTNELRTNGTANLLRGAIEAGARRFVAESFVSVYGPTFSQGLTTEHDTLWAVRDGVLKDSVLALRSLEAQLGWARDSGRIETVALRFGFLYGPDVPSTEDLVSQAVAGRLLAPRNMDGIGGVIHVADATAAIVAAIEAPAPSSVYNVVDDEPLAPDRFLELLTRAVAAPPPRSVPAWLARLAAPVVTEMGSANWRISNARAKRELAWSLRFPTARAGLADLARGSTPRILNS